MRKLMLLPLLCLSGCFLFVQVDKEKKPEPTPDSSLEQLVEQEAYNYIKGYGDIYEGAKINVENKIEGFETVTSTMEWIYKQTEELKNKNTGGGGEAAKHLNELFYNEDKSEKNLDKLPQALEEVAKGFHNVIE